MTSRKFNEDFESETEKLTTPPQRRKRAKVTSSGNKIDKMKNSRTIKDLFGSDSEDELQSPKNSTTTLPVSFVKKVANGITKQVLTGDNKKEFYTEIKLYKTSDVEYVNPRDRWLHALVSAKVFLDTENDNWTYLQRLMRGVRDEFKAVSVTFIEDKQQA